MTDVTPAMPPSEVVPDDFRSAYPCPQLGCDKAFPTRLGLQGHQTSHRQPIPCPECGKQYKTAGALGNHRKTMHGVRPLSAPPSAPVGRPAKQPTPVVQAWHTDDIFESVAHSLWPNGLIPVRCIRPLVEWREATREFLEKVQSE